jgi:hypothetical protein
MNEILTTLGLHGGMTVRDRQHPDLAPHVVDHVDEFGAAWRVVWDDGTPPWVGGARHAWISEGTA